MNHGPRFRDGDVRPVVHVADLDGLTIPYPAGHCGEPEQHSLSACGLQRQVAPFNDHAESIQYIAAPGNGNSRKAGRHCGEGELNLAVLGITVALFCLFGLPDGRDRHRAARTRDAAPAPGHGVAAA